jgi:AcrR family transcriptional regulator
MGRRMSMLKSINPTAKQSQQWIIQALLDLMEKTEYDKISVSEICHKADLDRRTFYRNFNSKNDVLEQYIIRLGEEYIKSYAAMDIPCKYTAAKIFFEFWSRYLPFIRNIQKCGLSDFIFQQFENFTKEHTELLISDGVMEFPREYVLAYRIGGFWNVMMTWAAKDVMLSPEEMASIISRI